MKPISDKVLDFDPNEREVMRKVIDGVRWFDDICPTPDHYRYLRRFIDKGYISPSDWGSWLVEAKRHCLYVATDAGREWWNRLVKEVAVKVTS